MAFGSGFEHFEVQKNASERVMYPFKKIILGAPYSPPFTGIACWKLKGL
jgi:hypothetical protein